MKALKVTSPAYLDHGMIPIEYTASKGANENPHAKNIFPGYEVSNVPGEARSLIWLLFDELDDDFWEHMRAVGPANLATLPKGANKPNLEEGGLRYFENNAKEADYTGPYTAASGRYKLVVLASTMEPDEVTAFTRETIYEMLGDTIVGRGELTGIYTNPKYVEQMEGPTPETANQGFESSPGDSVPPPPRGNQKESA